MRIVIAICWISLTFLIQQNIFALTMAYYRNNISINTLCFLCSLLLSATNEYIWFQSNKFFNINTSCFIFHSTNNKYFYLAEFAKFIGKHLCWSHFLTKLQVSRHFTVNFVQLVKKSNLQNSYG